MALKASTVVAVGRALRTIDGRVGGCMLGATVGLPVGILFRTYEGCNICCVLGATVGVPARGITAVAVGDAVADNSGIGQGGITV